MLKINLHGKILLFVWLLSSFLKLFIHTHTHVLRCSEAMYPRLASNHYPSPP